MRVNKTPNGLFYYIIPNIDNFTDTSIFVKDNSTYEKVFVEDETLNLPFYFDNIKKYLYTKFKLWKGERITLRVPNSKINIRRIQKSLREDELFELDFKDNVSIVITNDNIFLDRWDPHCKPLTNIRFWWREYADNYSKSSVEYITDFDSDDLDKILDDMLDECIYDDKYSELPGRVAHYINNELTKYYIKKDNKELCPYCELTLKHMECPKCKKIYIKDHILFNIPNEEDYSYGIYYNVLYFEDNKFILAHKLYKINYITKEIERNEFKIKAKYIIKEDGIFNELTNLYAYKDYKQSDLYIGTMIDHIDYKYAPANILKVKKNLDEIIKENCCISLFTILYNTYFSSECKKLLDLGLPKIAYDQIYYYDDLYNIKPYNITLTDEEISYAKRYDISYQELLRLRETNIKDYFWIRSTTNILYKIFIEGYINLFTNKPISSNKELNKYQKRIDKYFKDNEEDIYNYLVNNYRIINKEIVINYIKNKIKENEI